MTNRVAYLVNQYPKTTHSFIRREIRALEAQGVTVDRYSVRDTSQELKDPADVPEAARTQVLLRTSIAGALRLGGALSRRALKAPLKTARAVRHALQLGAHADRGRLIHLVYLAEAALLAEHLREADVTHLHAHFGTNSATVAMLCQELGGPGFSFTAHGPEEFDKPDLIALAEKIARARFVVGVSSFGKSQLLRRTPGASWDKVKVVPCGVDAAFLDPSWHRPVPDAPRLCCVGRICEQKGQLLLIEAVARVAATGRAVELVLVGDGEMRGQAEALIQQHGLERKVRITGWAATDRVREEILSARAMVLPSFAEGLPVVIMEALALGRPVISTYVAGIPELVENGADGWVVPAGSVDALVGAIEAVLAATPQQLDVMGAEGRRRVADQHDAEKAALLLKDAFSSVG